MPSLASIKLIGIGIAILSVFLSGWTVNGWRWQGKLETAVEAQKNADSVECTKEKKITEESQHDLQNRFNVISTRLTQLKRVQPAKCVIPATSTADTAAGRGGHADQNGISADWLRDYAAECETYRSQRIALEEFEKRVWEGQ